MPSSKPGGLEWFPFNARDWLTGPMWLLTNEQRGAFMQLAARAWLEPIPASLPNSDPVLAKMADMDMATWATTGAAIRMLWIEGDDGRLRNEWLTRLWVDASDRHGKAKEKAIRAANARWGRDTGGDAREVEGELFPGMLEASGAHAPSTRGAGVHVATAGELNAAVTPYADLRDWLTSTGDRKALLRRFLEEVYKRHGRDALSGFAALLNLALQGGGSQLPRLSPDQVETAVGDWLDTDTVRSKHSLRSFLRAAAKGLPPTQERKGRRLPHVERHEPAGDSKLVVATADDLW
jgi:uncharacterized protein YdaU (DUF1376 family)